MTSTVAVLSFTLLPYSRGPIRDVPRAGWIMGPTNEVTRGIVGRWALHGYQAVDWWNQRVNENVLNGELGKLDSDGKRALIDRLNKELDDDR